LQGFGVPSAEALQFQFALISMFFSTRLLGIAEGKEGTTAHRNGSAGLRNC
jgi:hypothetical protein